MPNLNELLLAVQYNKNVDLQTLNASPGWWRFQNLNKRIWAQRAVAESDAGEIGSGHEFPTTAFKSHYENGAYTIERYVSSDFAAWVFAFSLGHVVRSGSTPNFIYTITPLTGATDGIEVPYFGFVQQMRPGGSAVLDQLFVGCALNGWRLSLRNGVGRGTAMLSADAVNSGICTEPSAVSIPALAAGSGGFKELPLSSMALTILGTDYVSVHDWMSLDAAWSNNFRAGWFPGAPTQDGYATQGRFEVGDRACGLSFVARFKNGSSELTKVRALTTGTLVLSMTYDSNNMITLTWPQVRFSMAEVGDADGIVTVSVACEPQYHATNGIFSAVCKVAGYSGGICQ